MYKKKIDVLKVKGGCQINKIKVDDLFIETINNWSKNYKFDKKNSLLSDFEKFYNTYSFNFGTVDD